MKKRFLVVDDVTCFLIEDTQSIEFNLPKAAVTLHFLRFEDAKIIVDIMNKEWERFLKNPY